MSLLLLLVVLICFIVNGVVEAANIAQNDWNTLKSFFSIANCKTEFCNALSNNQTCLLPIVCDAGGNVLQLQLNNYNLSGSLVSEIAQLKQLQSLVLSNNRFNSTIPSELAQLSSLTLLDLSNNSFVGSVPAEFDQSGLKQVSLHGNLLSGYVPFFSLAINCSLQLVIDGNKFCCPKFLSQVCCGTNNCKCSSGYVGCSKFAPVPPRCDLLDENGPNHALCMTENTMSSALILPRGYLVDNFTIAFWAKAREPLNFAQNATPDGIVYIPRGLLFFPSQFMLGVDREIVGVGVYLGTDGLSIVQHSDNRVAAIVVMRRKPSIDWHHYTVTFTDKVPNVYVDGLLIGSPELMRSVGPSVKSVGFDGFVGRLQGSFYVRFPSVAFEGWVSELGLANRSMNGLEAMQESANLSLWDANYRMRGCSGENHTGTEIDRLGLQQAWLVCREPLPTCGAQTNSFNDWEPAGCLCEDENQTRTCVNGYYSQDSDAVVSTRPEVYWRLDENADDSLMIHDSSGNGRHGVVKEAPAVYRRIHPETILDGSTICVNGDGHVDFGDIQALNFGTRDFFISFWMRTSVSHNITYGYILSKAYFNTCVCPCYGNNWLLAIYDGFLVFDVDEDNNGTHVAHLYKKVTRVNDNRWHFVEAARFGSTLSLWVDNVSQGSATGSGVANLANNRSVLVGAVIHCGALAFHFSGELANISIRVGAPRRQLCSSSQSGYSSSTYLQSTGCKRVVGFCAPSKQGRQCCGARYCSECGNTYRSCSRDFSLNGSTKTTSLLSSSTTTTSTMTMITATENSLSPSSSSSSTSPTTTINSTSVTIDVAANSQVLPTIGWIGVVIGTLLCGLLVGVAVASTVLRKRSTLSASQTSLGKFHSVKNEDESQQPSRYSAIPPKPDHPYVDASFISIAEANEEIGRAMEQEANNKKSNY